MVLGKEAVLFLKKKNQKDFFNSGPRDLVLPTPFRRQAGMPHKPREAEQKFFAPLFFKKAASSL
jgi:hypothetical protein